MIDQIAILVLGVGAVYLSQDPKPKVSRWAGILGLVSQPFWFYSSYTTESWGIFLASFLYTYCWGRGVYYNWIKKNEIPTGT